MTELVIPKVKDNLPSVDFSADEYRAKCRRMTDGQLDREVERTVQAGVKGLVGFARAYHQNGIARYERGKRTENQQGERKDLLPGGNKLSPAERKQRSEDMVVAEWLDDEGVEEILEDGRGFNALVTQARHNKRESQVANSGAVIEVTPQDVKTDFGSLLFGDFRERLDDLPDGSVDLIVTDPPYPHEDIMLWTDLAKVAARLLGPRGILFAYSGQIFLPEVMERLESHLTYGWTFNLSMLKGKTSRIMGRHLIQTWKPVLAYTKGTWPSGRWVTDTIKAPKQEKDLYEWQQPVAPAQQIIEDFSAPGALIVDPFLGVGSFGVAAQQAGRRFVGVEIDSSRFNQSVERFT